MERQANYILIGAVFVAFLFGFFIFVVWLANLQFNQQFDNYRIEFAGPVTGISVGGTVDFNGIRMGEISAISLDEEDANLVLVDVQMEAGTPIRQDSVASAKSQGITGTKRIDISAGTPTMPMLRDVSTDDPPIIQSQGGELSDILNSIEQIADGGSEVVTRVNSLLSDQNIENVSRTLADVQVTASELSANRELFASMNSAFSKINVAADELQETLAAVRQTLGNNERGALAEFAQASSDIRATAADLRGLVERMEQPVNEFSENTVPEMTTAIVSIRRAADSIDALAQELEEEPASIFNRRAGQEVEIPQ